MTSNNSYTIPSCNRPEHRVIPYTWWFYFPNRKAAEQAAKALENSDFLTKVDPPLEDLQDDWLMRAAKPRCLKCDDAAPALDTIARDLGGELDGGESGWFQIGPEGTSFLEQE